MDDYYWLHDVLRISVGVPAWVMQWDGRAFVWRDLSLVLPPLAPYHFEIALHREDERDAYHERCVKRVLDSGQPYEGELFGFHDLFVPVGRRGRGGSVLYFGQYLARLPDYQALRASWRAMAGRDAAPADPDFDAFVSSALRLPVLPQAARQGLVEFALFFAAHLRGEVTRQRLEPQLNALRRRAFVPYLPHPVWAYQAIGFDAQRPVPWHPGRELADWMKAELGLQQPPTGVLACLPLNQDPAQARVLARALLGRTWAWARARGGVTVAPLSEDGVLLLAETPQRQSQARQAAALRELAHELRRFAGNELGLDVAVGVGDPVPLGERLFPSYQQAVLALQMAVQEGKRVLLHAEAPRTAGPATYAALARSARELAACFELGTAEALSVALDGYVRRVLQFASGRVDQARGQFLASAFLCLEAAGRRLRLGEAALAGLGQELSGGLEQARGMVDLLHAFNSGLRRLAVHTGPRSSGGASLQSFVAWLGEHSAKPLPLAAAARQAGLSVPAFTRAFRKATGSAYLPYLQRLRGEEAARLLRGSDLGLAEVATRCGFSSPHQLIRLFRVQFRATPGAYRARHQKALQGQ